MPTRTRSCLKGTFSKVNSKIIIIIIRAKKDDDDEEYYAGWKNNLNRMERKLQTAQKKEKSAGRNLSDSEGEDAKEEKKPKYKAKLNAKKKAVRTPKPSLFPLSSPPPKTKTTIPFTFYPNPPFAVLANLTCLAFP